jgi:nucleoside-diphosphate-sugar epimerase
MVDGTMTVVPRQRFGVADVRDVADAHIRAMTTPAGTDRGAPGAELPDLVIHNERAKRVLGWRPRQAETTIVETAESLRDLGLLERRAS